MFLRDVGRVLHFKFLVVVFGEYELEYLSQFFFQLFFFQLNMQPENLLRYALVLSRGTHHRDTRVSQYYSNTTSSSQMMLVFIF